MRRLDHINIIQLKYFFFSSEEKVSWCYYHDNMVHCVIENVNYNATEKL